VNALDIPSAAIILAAGASTRMGRPKALLEIDGETFLDRLIRVFAAAGVMPVVVLGHDAGVIAAGCQRAAEALLALNPHPELGQLSSLQCGLRAAPAHAELLFFTPVDSPGVRVTTVLRLRQEWAERGRPPVVTPRFAGRNGHPVGIHPSMAGEILNAPSGATARGVLAQHQSETLRVEVDDPAVLWDLDDECALRAALDPGVAE
jgi:molybdenum cofactor cytidylyltransferase